MLRSYLALTVLLVLIDVMRMAGVFGHEHGLLSASSGDAESGSTRSGGANGDASKYRVAPRASPRPAQSERCTSRARGAQGSGSPKRLQRADGERVNEHRADRDDEHAMRRHQRQSRSGRQRDRVSSSISIGPGAWSASRHGGDQVLQMRC